MDHSSFHDKTAASSTNQKLRLRRMPAIANLKAIFCSKRTSRSVSAVDVTSSTIPAAQIPSALPLPESTMRNRRLAYDLLTGRSHHSASQTSLLVGPSHSPRSSLRSETTSLSEFQYAGPSGSTPSSRGASHEASLQRKTSLSPDPASSPSIQRTPSDKVRKHPQSTNYIDTPPRYTSTSTDRAVKRWRRKHVMIGGQLILPLGMYFDAESETDEPDEPNTPAACNPSTTIAVGARPLLQTCQGFPFDLRRSRPEASRLMDDGTGF